MITRHMRVLWISMLPFALSSVQGAWAGPPTDQLREGVEQVVLKDPELRGDRKIETQVTPDRCVGTHGDDLRSGGAVTARRRGYRSGSHVL